MSILDYFHNIKNNPANKTSISICDLWFHITWTGEQGTDQDGNIWINKEKPEPLDSELYDEIFDTYNHIQKYIKTQTFDF